MTSLNKLDATQLLQKVDGQALLENVLRYLDIKLVGRTLDGNKFRVNVGSIGSRNSATSTAECNGDEAVTACGFFTTGIPEGSEPRENGWLLVTDFDHDYELQAKVQCMKVEVGIKPVGGGPLLPPSD